VAECSDGHTMMAVSATPPLLTRYVDAIRSLPSKPEYTKSDLCTNDFLVFLDRRLEMFYGPFDSITRSAKIAIVGVTPGFQQMEIAIRVVRQALHQGAHCEEACVLAKQAASFAGGMRRNLIAMLDGIGISEGLGIYGCTELFEDSYHLTHTTSAIRYPIFVGGENYTGHVPSMLDHPLLRSYVFDVLAPELSQVSEALIVPLGKAVDEVIASLISAKRLNRERCLVGFPHPSPGNGHRKRLFEQNRESMAARVSQWFSGGVRATVVHSRRQSDLWTLNAPIVRPTTTEEIRAKRTASSGKETNMVDKRELLKVFDQSGFANTKNINKTAEFRSRSNERYLYLNKVRLLNNCLSIYIEDTLPESRVPGTREVGVRFSSNLTQFPTKMHTGKTPCHYGRVVEADNLVALSDFLRWFSGLS